MESVVKSVRVREDLWEGLRKLSRKKNRPLSQLLNEALERYLGETDVEEAVEKIRSLPELSLGEEPLTREELYEDSLFTYNEKDFQNIPELKLWRPA